MGSLADLPLQLSSLSDDGGRAASQDFLKDTLLSAMTANTGERFSTANTLVVPVPLGKSATCGMASPIWQRQGYVASPPADSLAAWQSAMNVEVAAAEKQGAKDAGKGIVLVVGADGKVVRRGLGRVLWK